jgi:hypothetical protein
MQLQQKLPLLHQQKLLQLKLNQHQLQKILHHQSKKVQQRRKHQQMINQDPKLKKETKKLPKKLQLIQTSKKHQHAQLEQFATNMKEKPFITKNHSTESVHMKIESAIKTPQLFHTSQHQSIQPLVSQPTLPKLHQRRVNISHQRLHQ